MILMRSFFRLFLWHFFKHVHMAIIVNLVLNFASVVRWRRKVHLVIVLIFVTVVMLLLILWLNPVLTHMMLVSEVVRPLVVAAIVIVPKSF